MFSNVPYFYATFFLHPNMHVYDLSTCDCNLIPGDNQLNGLIPSELEKLLDLEVLNLGESIEV